MVLNNFRSQELISTCVPLLTRLANEVMRIVCDDHTFATDDVLDFKDCLDRVSLATQILTLGLWLFSQDHTGSVHPFFLVNPLLHIYLFGAQPPVQDSNLAQVQVSLSTPTCMARVMGDRVAVFGSCHSTDLRSSDKSYDLLASPEALAETWTVGRFIKDAGAPPGGDILAIKMAGDGYIICAGEVQHSADLGITILKLHWKTALGDLRDKTPFSLHSKALITAEPAS